jgi:DNA-directed RNA polymerase specialized sigma24 family protein
MKISYLFDNGENTEVEVSAEIGEFITTSRRDEDSSDKKEHRHCISLDGIQYEGREFGTRDDSEDTDERNAKVKKAFSHLTDLQKRRIIMLAGGLSEREIARREGKDFKTVHESIEAARKKFKKFYR